MAKITRATVKSFVIKNRTKLFIRCESSFDGMIDCVTQTGNLSFKPAELSTQPSDNNLAVNGLWLVGRSNDLFREYDDGLFKGIHIYNCCGSSTIAVKK